MSSSSGSNAQQSVPSTVTKSKRSRKSRIRRLTAAEDVEHLRSTTDLVIPRTRFERLVREILADYLQNGRIQQQAINALQESVEMYISNLFEDALLLMAHRQRATLQLKDLKLAKHIGSPYI